MSPAEIQRLLNTRAFIPFRIVTSARTYEVRHPELVMVGLATVIVGVPDAGHPGVYSDIVSMRHIIHREPEAQPAA
jgi:hypothetical protein